MFNAKSLELKTEEKEKKIITISTNWQPHSKFLPILLPLQTSTGAKQLQRMTNNNQKALIKIPVTAGQPQLIYEHTQSSMNSPTFIIGYFYLPFQTLTARIRRLFDARLFSLLTLIKQMIHTNITKQTNTVKLSAQTK